MGYDMHVVDGAGKRVEGDNTYWRRNMSGGVWQAKKLVDLGLGYWPATEVPPFPDVEPYEYDDDTDEQRVIDAEAEKVYFAHLQATLNEQPGISVHKLCNSNDGWWVTKAECQSALQLWERAGEPDVDDGLGDTIPFLRAAAAHSGFRVW